MSTKPLFPPVKINVPESILPKANTDNQNLVPVSFQSMYEAGLLACQNGAYETAIGYTTESLNLAEKNHNEIGYLEAAILLNIIFEHTGQYPKNISHLHRVFELIKKTPACPQLAAAYASIGRLYYLLEDHPQALVYLFKSLEINSYLDNGTGLAKDYTYLADLYLTAQDVEQALFYARQSLFLCIPPVSDEQKISTLNTLAAIHFQNNQPGSANRRLQQARQLLAKISFPYEKTRAYLISGELFINQKQFEKSINALNSGYEIAKQHQMQTLITQFHYALARAHKQNSQYQEALEHYEAYHLNNQKQANATTARQLRSLETAHKIEAYSFRNHQLKREIQERAKNQAELIILATTDPLTGLFNRRHFVTLAEHWNDRVQQEHTNLSILMIDIDHFKKINDTHGHPIGDQALIHIAHMIQQSLRAQDILCRYGGEEFCVLLPDADIKAAQQVAERVLQNTSKILVLSENHSFQITVSIGIADSGTNPNQSIMSLLGHADQALYKAKQSGRNRSFSFFPSKNPDVFYTN
ncbi:MAG: hypothetical protein CVU39_25800 [Chloroflexi bacterium HGW-Chloroflexi-10]|nr:MAG: hypothetical protein CVU39_25800 [Chloroflexi bacterium HGW-Chloroflexi-10]